MSEIRKTEKEITGGAYLGSSLCGPASWPAQQASPAQPTTAVVLLAPVGQACGRRARTAGAPRHQLVCLPPPPARRRGASSRCRPDPLALSPSLSRAAPSLSLTAEHHHRRRSP